jgi:hypothetical protein
MQRQLKYYYLNNLWYNIDTESYILLTILWRWSGCNWVLQSTVSVVGSVPWLATQSFESIKSKVSEAPKKNNPIKANLKKKHEWTYICNVPRHYRTRICLSYLKSVLSIATPLTLHCYIATITAFWQHCY